MYTLMFHLTIVNKTWRHCHSWQAWQYIVHSSLWWFSSHHLSYRQSKLLRESMISSGTISRIGRTFHGGQDNRMRIWMNFMMLEMWEFRIWNEHQFCTKSAKAAHLIQFGYSKHYLWCYSMFIVPWLKIVSSDLDNKMCQKYVSQYQDR